MPPPESQDMPPSVGQTIEAAAMRAAAAEATRTGASGAGEASACLIALNPSFLHREYALSGARLTIGREAETCDVVCPGDTISRQHCAVVREGEAFFLEDLHATNGTYLNRQRIDARVPLKPGDVIALGNAAAQHLRFQVESGRNRPFTIDIPPKETWTLGRDPNADVPLVHESTVSSKHATVRRRGDQVEVADAGSLNGTWVNGRRVKRATLDPTDAVMIGSTLLRFALGEAGALRVTRRDCGDEVSLDCVGLQRDVGGGKLILDSVTLAVKPGEFVGILGPSGAGKSTLLKTLNGYNPPSYGCVLLNEMPLYPCFDMFRNSIGYVPQDDIVHQELTVASSLEYVAKLRLPPDVDAAQRRELIESTVETLGLSHVANSRIAELSGGQRKRVSIGCELMTRPSVLFLDEPTSGMDPSTEERLMRHFQSMARQGTTVLITTHILYNLDLLDRVIILARGRLVFFGTPAEAMTFFGPGGQPVERPTEVFETLEEAPPGHTGGDPRVAAAEYWAERYRESDLYARHVEGGLSGMSAELMQTARDETAAQPAQKTLLEKPTAGRQARGGFDVVSARGLGTLTRRNFAIKLVSVKRALFYLAVPLILALVTLSLRTSPLPDDAEMARKREEIAQGLTMQPEPIPGVPVTPEPVDLGPPVKELLAPGAPEDRSAADIIHALRHEGVANLPTPISVLLMFVMTSVFMGTLMACLDLSTERPIYVRERMASQRIADYVLSKLPFLLLVTAAQCAAFLALCWLKPDLRHMNPAGAYLALVAMAWAACCLGLFLSAIDPTAGQFSVILAIVAVLPQLVFSGGLGPDFYDGMPAVMKALANSFPARWGLEMLMTAFYHHPGREAVAWMGDFVRDTVGFGFGPAVYWRNTAVLALQAVIWLLLCMAAVKRLDRAR